MSNSALLVLIISLTNILIYQCESINGVIIAFEPPYLVEGGNATITCSMNLTAVPGNTSKDLNLYLDNDLLNSTKINSSTIEFTLFNVTVLEKDFTCEINNTLEAESKTLQVRPEHPRNVTDFKCRIYDFDFMECTFTNPSIKKEIIYSLSYSTEIDGIKISYISKNGTRINVTINSQNYRQDPEDSWPIDNKVFFKFKVIHSGHEFLYFELTGKNDAGDINTQKFTINQYLMVIPPPPKFDVYNIADSTAELKWSMVKYSQYNENDTYNEKRIIKSLEYQIFVRIANNDWIDFTNNSSSSSNGSIYTLKLMNLPYAFYSYDVGLRLRVTLKNNTSCTTYCTSVGEWSNFYNKTFTTLPRAPDYPPKIDIGSFQIDYPQSKVRLFWKKCPKYNENGRNFHYNIKSVRKNGVAVKDINCTKTESGYLCPWEERNAFEFEIESRNDEGGSNMSSYIKVPPLTKEIDFEYFSPKWIRNIHHSSNNSYTVSWIPPKSMDGLLSFTIFRCHSYFNRNDVCKDYIEFDDPLDKYQREFLYKSNDTDLNFAVSANYANHTTGMHWHMCTAEDSTSLEILEPNVNNTFTNALEISWQLHDCRSVHEGFNISYCEVAENSQTAKCINESITKSIDKTETLYLIEGLYPHKWYKIQMRRFSILQVSQLSQPIFGQTKETAPTAPYQLQYENVRNNSVKLHWLPPIQRNGIIRKYHIHFNSETRTLDCLQNRNICQDNDRIDYELDNLSCYTSYKIYVTAETISKSTSSNDIHIHTLIGVPSEPQNFEVNYQTGYISWEKPKLKTGNITYYEVEVIQEFNNTVQNRGISYLLDPLNCVVKNPCIHANLTIKYAIRAVNVRKRETVEIEEDAAQSETENTNNDNNNHLICENDKTDKIKIADYLDNTKYIRYNSAWEKRGDKFCPHNSQNSDLPIQSFIALVVLITGITTMITFYFGRKEYKVMVNITAKLPDPIEAIINENKKIYEDRASVGGPKNKNVGGNASSILKKNYNSRIEADIEFHDKKESLEHPESLHLLAPTTCNDSIHRNVVDVHNGVRKFSIEHSTGKEGSCGYIQQEALQQVSGGGDTPVTDTGSCYTIMTPVDDNSGYQLMTPSPHIDDNILPLDGYVLPRKYAITNPNALALTISPSTASTQEKPKEKFIWPAAVPDSGNNGTAPKNNGYTPFNLLLEKEYVKAPQSQNSEYTTLESLATIPKQLNSNNNNDTTINVENNDKYYIMNSNNNNDMPPMSGYVTQSQLNVFGQHHQQYEKQQQQQQQLVNQQILEN